MVKAFNNLCIMLYCGMKSFIEEEKGAVDIVAIVIMIGIAVLVAVLFRGRITTLIGDLFDTIDESASGAIT